MASKTIVLVAGANSGIGYEAVKALLQSSKPYHILFGSRSSEKAQVAIGDLKKEVPEATNTIETLEVDLVSDESIGKAFKSVKEKYGRVDLLINNAGVTFDIAYINGEWSLRECFNKAYDINVAGTHVFTTTFIPLLLKSHDPRLLFVTGLSAINQASKQYFPTPPQPSGWPKNIAFETIGYRCSKTALNMLMLDWNHKLKAGGVKVWAVSPGMCATNLGGLGPERAYEMGGEHPRRGGLIIRSVVEGERDDDVGKIVAKDGISDW
ncbi:hypothetical protein EYC80_010814 [Monilinia laxa]|uniref:Uncharacterized protein n=1 Tax=Monilinia laxa TaxID=61186 RepID=A0A5N6JP90_MONLA|nr:hypothetical protein EYC80_010814 [Monilinia laxa]